VTRAAAICAGLFLLLAALGPPAGLISETMGWAGAPARVVAALEPGSPPTVKLVQGFPGVTPGEAPTVDIAGRGTLGPLAVRRTDLRPTWSFEVGDVTLPWMVNGYTSGLVEWPGRLLSALFGPTAALRLHLLLGALLVGGATALAWRLAGPVAGWATGAWLATDPFLLLQSRILGPHTPLLALLALAGLLMLERGRDGAAGFAWGLGLAVKGTFAAPLAALGLGLAVARRRPRAVLFVGLAVGVVPSAMPIAFELADSVAAPDVRMPGLDRLDLRAAKPQGGAREDRANPKRMGAHAWLAGPVSWWRQYLLRDGAPHRGALDAASFGSAGLLLLVAFAGLLRPRGRRFEPGREQLGQAVVIAGMAAIPAIRFMHPDTHHLPLATPVVALAIGVGLAGAPRRLALAALIVATTLRGGGYLDLRDEAADDRWRADAPTQQALLAAVVQHGATDVAYFDYGLYQMVEGYAPELEPWYWGHAYLGGLRSHDCFLRVHAGGWLLLPADGPPASPAAGVAQTLTPRDLPRLGSRAGLESVSVQPLAGPGGETIAWLAKLGPATGWSACEPVTPTRRGSRPGPAPAP